jgi:hypothetical protein
LIETHRPAKQRPEKLYRVSRRLKPTCFDFPLLLMARAGYGPRQLRKDLHKHFIGRRRERAGRTAWAGVGD